MKEQLGMRGKSPENCLNLAFLPLHLSLTVFLNAFSERRQLSSVSPAGRAGPSRWCPDRAPEPSSALRLASLRVSREPGRPEWPARPEGGALPAGLGGRSASRRAGWGLAGRPQRGRARGVCAECGPPGIAGAGRRARAEPARDGRRGGPGRRGSRRYAPPAPPGRAHPGGAPGRGAGGRPCRDPR